MHCKTEIKAETRNYFAPLRSTAAMDCTELEGNDKQDEQ
jgi:hypothetical protein